MIRETLQSALCLFLTPLLFAQQLLPTVQNGNSPGIVPATAKNAGTIALKRKSVVPLVLLESVSSASAQKGEEVRLAVAKDVSVEGTVLIPKGTPATGVIAYARKALPGKRDGEVRIKLVSLTLPDGRDIPLREIAYSGGDEVCEGFASCAALTVIVIILLPISIVGSIAVSFPHHRKVEGHDQEFGRCQSIWASTVAKIRISPLVVNLPQLETEFPCPTRP